MAEEMIFPSYSEFAPKPAQITVFRSMNQTKDEAFAERTWPR